MTTTIEALLAKAKPREATARILLDQTLLNEYSELAAELDATVTQGALERPPHVAELAERVSQLESRIEAEKDPFLFRGIGNTKWMALLGQHPPTPQQLAAMTPEERRIVDHNPETFPLAAVAASLVDPELSLDDVKQLHAVVGVAQWQQLWSACLIANVGGNQDPKSLAAGLIRRRNGASATTAATEESLEASSSDAS